MSRTARVLHAITDIDATRWNACANPQWCAHNPFLRHEFLAALEGSGSASAQTGWQPFHIALEEGDELLGVMPAYLKGHSQGEYVFDHSWADALHRAGGNYYPKMQSCVPFTPATGRRLLTANEDADAARDLLSAAVQVAHQTEVSSLHLTFQTESEWHLAQQVGLLQRMDQQFHWHNPGYTCFDDFLADLASKKAQESETRAAPGARSGRGSRVG